MGLIQALNLRNAKVTATGNSGQTALSGYYVSPGSKECFAVQSTLEPTASTDPGTLTCYVQASATTVDTDFATCATFTAVADTDATQSEQVNFLIPANTKYLRHRAVATGTPALVVQCSAFLVKRVS